MKAVRSIPRAASALVGALLWLGGVGHSAEAGSYLVATRRIEPTAYELSLPEKLGVLLAGREQLLAFEVPGRLTFLEAEGRSIEAGQVVARLDDALKRAQLDRAEVLFEDSVRALRRLRQLRRSQVASATALEDAESAVELRQAERDAAAAHLARKHLTARWAGVIVNRLVDPGEVVTAGQPVASLMNLERLRIETGIPGYQIGKVAVGQRAWISISAFPGRQFSGTVTQIPAAAPDGTHLFNVEIAVPNPDARLRPGQTARVRIVTRTLNEILVVPLRAVVERGGLRLVFFELEGKALGHGIEDGIVHEDVVLISDGVPSHNLIVRGQRDLREGDPVKVDNSILAGKLRP